MGRRPCCEKEEVNTGAWTAEEDRILIDYVRAHGEGRWGRLPKNAGLNRCGKSCRFRWLNYLRPDIKRGNISPDEEELILRLHKLLGNRWSLIAGRLPGRTDNEIKNYWNTILCKRARDDSPKLRAPRKLRRYPDKSEGKSNLKLEENDSTLRNPSIPVQPPLSEREPPVSLAAFWAATLKRSEVDINWQLSLRRGEDNDRCFDVNNGGPRPWPPLLDGDVSVKSEIAEVEKDGAATGSGGGEAGEIPAEDLAMDFDIGDICLSDLLNSELLVGNNS